MQLSFHGAARTVTGSKHIVHLDNGIKILLDCGLFQGLGKDTLRLNTEWGFDPQAIDVVVLSHAHIDHVGLLPKLVKNGFKGKAWCTPGTADLAAILMRDSARIQEGDIAYINHKRRQQERPLAEALYTEEDAGEAVKRLITLDYDVIAELVPGVRLSFTDAGHLLGSACVHLYIEEEGSTKRVTFSGDVGRYRDAILRAPEPFPQAEVIIMECTYGNSLHEFSLGAADELRRWIDHTCMEKGGKLIIPAFSVGRTQELLYQLNRLELEHRLPPVKYYVDSPLSIEATEIIKQHPECYNEDVERVLRTDDDVFLFEGLEYIRTSQASQALNSMTDPCVIISSSGMAEAGRVKHHIVHAIGDAKNTILLVGYCEAHSLGGKLKAGASEVNIYGHAYEVKAEVGNIASMSAHGDYDDLLHWLSCQDAGSIGQMFLVHGEPDIQEAFRDRLKARGYDRIEIPAQHEVFALQG